MTETQTKCTQKSITKHKKIIELRRWEKANLSTLQAEEKKRK